MTAVNAPEPSDDDGTASEFTGAWLRSLIESRKILSDNFAVPSTLRLQPLADRLATIHALARLTETGVRAEDTLPIRASQALAVLSEVLPALKARADGWLSKCRELDLDQNDFPIVKGLVEAGRGLQDLMQSVAAGQDNFMLKPAFSSVPVVQHVNDFAEEIGEAFRLAVRASNPGRRTLGNSNTGPVASFIAAVSPYITGEIPNTEAVARFLRRASEGDKPN